MTDMNPEQLTPIEGDPQVSANFIAPSEADRTISKLMVQFTGDEAYRQVIEARQGIIPEGEVDTEKLKKGKVRGAIIPLVATGVGIGASNVFGSAAYKLGKSYAEVSGSVPSPLFNTISVIDKLPVPAIASVGAGAASLTASAIRRAFGENVFEYYSRYSHLDADGNFITKPIKKIFNWYARGPEHLAFNTFITNPAEPGEKVQELINESKREDFETVYPEYERNHVENMVSKGYLHLTSAEATQYYGAEFNEEEKVRIAAVQTEIKDAINKFTNKIPEAEREEFNQKVYEKVLKAEKIKYLLASGIMSSISALKALALGSVFDLVHDSVLPRIFPGSGAAETANVTAESPVTNAVVANSKTAEATTLARETGEVATVSHPTVRPEGFPVPSLKDYAERARDTQSVPVTSLGDYAGTTLRPNLGDVEVLSAPAITKLDLEVTTGQSALDALPSLSASGIAEGASTVESIFSMSEGLSLLSQVSTENPEAIVGAWTQVAADPGLPEGMKDLIGSVGQSAPEIIYAIQSSGPQGLWLLNKILQGMACAGSIPSGGMACPALAGP